MTTVGQYVVQGQNVILGKDVVIENFVEIQDNVTIGDRTVIRSFARIGKGCTIGPDNTIKCGAILGPNVKTMDRVFIGPNTVFVSGKGKEAGSLAMNGAWIGANCVIEPGCVVGSLTVLGANSLLKTDMSEGLWFGTPAKFIRPIPWEELQKLNIPTVLEEANFDK